MISYIMLVYTVYDSHTCIYITARAEVEYYEYNNTLKAYALVSKTSFPLTALEFGGMFQGVVLSK